MDKVCYFEIPADNIAWAKKFYRIFGWQIIDMQGMDYVEIRTVAVDKKTNAEREKGYQ